MSEENNEGGSSEENSNAGNSEELNRITAKYELEKKHRKNAESKYGDLENRFNDLSGKFESVEMARQKADAEKSGNWESLEKSFNEKAGKLEEQYKGQLSERDSIIQDLTVNQAASALSSKLFGEDAELLSHVVKGRLMGDIDGGKARTIVLDANGQPSALTLDELHDEIFNDPRYKRYAVGSNASGGGANGSSAKSSGATQKTMNRADFYKLPESKRRGFFKEGGKLN